MAMQFTSNAPSVTPGSVVNSVKIKSESWRFMIMINPRTGNEFAGVFIELDTPTDKEREIWILATPGQGGKIWKRAESWQRKAYINYVDKVETGMVDKGEVDAEVESV